MGVSRTVEQDGDEAGSWIALEGMPGVGKTTVLRSLEAELSPRLAVVPVIVDPPQFRAREASPRERDLWFLEALVEQAATLKHADRGRAVITDRGPISLLSYAYARSTHDGDWASYDWLCDRVRERSDDLPMPDGAIVLLTDVHESIARKKMQTHFATAGPWLERSFVIGMRDFYSQELRAVFPSVATVTLEISTSPVATVLQDVKSAWTTLRAVSPHVERAGMT